MVNCHHHHHHHHIIIIIVIFFAPGVSDTEGVECKINIEN